MTHSQLKLEIKNYFNENNYRNSQLAELSVPEIYEHAKKLNRELVNYKREVKFEGEVKDIFNEMINFLSFVLGLELLNK